MCGGEGGESEIRKGKEEVVKVQVGRKQGNRNEMKILWGN